MKNPIKTFEPNILGKDYVIGDLHGAYAIYENLIKNLNFDPQIDRMFSVGDLIDRGPKSLACMSLIRQPYFHAVLANHERMMLSKFDGGWEGNYWYQNGGAWGMEAYNSFVNTSLHITGEDFELHDLLPLVEELPFLITVNTKSGRKFHILHAELPSGINGITDDVLTDPEIVVSLATVQHGDGDSFLWNRSLFGSFNNKDLSNQLENIRIVKSRNTYKMFNDQLSHIISGHTVLTHPLTIIGQTNIDTGAVHSNSAENNYGLICIELDSWKFYKATADTFSEVTPVVISKEDLA